MKVLIDTSVWIQHLRGPLPELALLIQNRQVLVHPLVIGELACGALRDRDAFLVNLKLLPKAAPAQLSESIELIETHSLYNRGLGFSDVQLLASALLSGSKLWTLDQALERAATQLGVGRK